MKGLECNIYFYFRICDPSTSRDLPQGYYDEDGDPSSRYSTTAQERKIN